LDEQDFLEFPPIKESNRTDGTKPNFEERMFFCLFSLAVVTTCSQTRPKFVGSFSFDFWKGIAYRSAQRSEKDKRRWVVLTD